MENGNYQLQIENHMCTSNFWPNKLWKLHSCVTKGMKKLLNHRAIWTRWIKMHLFSRTPQSISRDHPQFYDYDLSIWCFIERCLHKVPVEVVATKMVFPRGQWQHMNWVSSPFFMKCSQTLEWPRGKYQSSPPLSSSIINDENGPRKWHTRYRRTRPFLATDTTH